jgi:hypothetical protein
MAEPEGEYIVVDPLVLETIKELARLAHVDRHTLPTVRLLLQVVRIDADGNLAVAMTVTAMGRRPQVVPGGP